LAENYAFLGEIDKSLRQYERLAEINPRYMGVYSRIAKIYIEKEEIEKAKEYLQKEHDAYPFENEHYIYSMHICFLEDDFEKANRILDRLFAIGPNEDDLLIFKINNDLNLKLVEYDPELEDLNERVKAYLEKNFNYSF
jgi:tetratricopeptide (TPR) repeat protein